MKYLLIVGVLLISIRTNAQVCDCEKEFLYIKKIVEHNFAGFPDRIKALSKAAYKRKTDQLLQLTRNKFASDNCPLIITEYLDLFKSHHLGFSLQVDFSKIDTAFVNHRPIFKITDEEIAKLKKSQSWEGIYYFVHDSSTTIAVVKDPTPLHDYVGITLESTRPGWKKGLVKFEGKLVNDSLLSGLLYMRNHRPKFEQFLLWDDNNMIGGDWRRMGTTAKRSVVTHSAGQPSPTIDAKRLTSNTFYLKMGSFNLNYKPQIDSILKANEHILNSTPNLVLDVRDNGGGGDASWQPLIPYLYTQPIKTIGVDILATELTISGYKKYLDFKNLSKNDVDNLHNEIAKMEKAKGQWVNIHDDQTDSSFQPKPFPEQ